MTDALLKNGRPNLRGKLALMIIGGRQRVINIETHTIGQRWRVFPVDVPPEKAWPFTVEEEEFEVIA